MRKGTNRATSAADGVRSEPYHDGARRTPNRNTRRTGDPCTVGQKSSRVPPVSALRHFVAAEGADDVSWGNRPLTLRPATVSPRSTTTGRASVRWPNAAGATGGGGSEDSAAAAAAAATATAEGFSVLCFLHRGYG